ncbi:hypothetical protein FRB90_012391 [Tulasnella sp. 427]|nr:hypothetical protein FRB90_012391 [Tulasnella sp. 427]
MLDWEKLKKLLKAREPPRPLSIRPYKPPPISDKKPHPLPGYWETKGSPLLASRSNSAPAIDATLPFELLLDILSLVLLQTDRPGQCLLNLSLVCKHWRKAAKRLELIRVELRERPDQVDRLLEHLHALGDDPFASRCRIRVLHVKASPYKDFHRLPEVLALARSTVQELRLNRAGFHNVRHVRILSGLEPHPVDEPEIFTTTRDTDVIFPRLRVLQLEGMLAYEVVHLIACCDRTKLELIELGGTRFPTSPDLPPVLKNRMFPNLQRVVFKEGLPKENPLPAYFFSSAPLLQQIDLVITFADIDDTVKLLRNNASSSAFKRPKLTIKLEGEQELETADSKAMFTGVEENIPGLVCGTKPQPDKTAESKADQGTVPARHDIAISDPEVKSICDKESVRQPHSTPPLERSFKVPTSPKNDTLPAEVLIDIFDALITISADPSPIVVETLCLVCRSWRNAGRGMELLRISISKSQTMDALLKHIYTTPLFQRQNRANIRILTVQTGYQQELRRLDELLTLCRTSLQHLVLGRYFVNTFDVELLHNAKQEAGSDFYFPNITSLSLSTLGSLEPFNFITAVDPAKLERLHILATYFWRDHSIREELESLRLPLLKEIRFDGRCKDDIPTIPWLYRVAPNIEMLVLAIRRPTLPTLTQYMSSKEILGSLKTLKLWVRVDRYDDLRPESEDLAPLVAVIKRRGWKQWICVQMSHDAS